MGEVLEEGEGEEGSDRAQIVREEVQGEEARGMREEGEGGQVRDYVVA